MGGGDQEGMILLSKRKAKKIQFGKLKEIASIGTPLTAPHWRKSSVTPTANEVPMNSIRSAFWATSSASENL